MTVQSRLAHHNGNARARMMSFGSSNISPPIPLEKTESEFVTGQYTTIKVRTTAQANSPQREIQVPYFKTGTPEEFLEFWAKVNEIVAGQRITLAAQKFSLVRTLLRGDALATWMNKASALHRNPDPAHANEDLPETNDNYETCWKVLAYHVLPTRALQRQRRYIRRHLRKPQSMNFRVFTARVLELNGYMAFFPNGQLNEHGVPLGFGVEQSLPADELLDILEFALPNTWQKLLIEHGIDLLKGTPDFGLRELASFCERKELTESMEKHLGPRGKNSESVHTEPTLASKSSGTGAQNKNKNKIYKKRDNKRKSEERSEKYCPLHNSYGHDSNDCKVLQTHAKKLREGYSNLSQSTHLFKEKEDKKKQANQLRTAIEKVIEEKVTKSKKRKNDRQEVRFAKESEDEDDNLFAFHDAREQNDSSSEEFNDIHLEELSLSSDK